MKKWEENPKEKNKENNNVQNDKIRDESNFMLKTIEDDMIKMINNIKLFKIIYSEFSEKDEIQKFDKINKLLDECKEIFKDIEKGNKDILNKWQNKFKNNKDFDELITKLKNNEQINDKKNFYDIIKNLMIITKKSLYYSDIKCILFFINLFEANETELTKNLKEKKNEYEDENFNFNKLLNIYKYLEEKKIYINNGKDDSSLIKFIRFIYNKKNEINFLKTKDVDLTTILLYRLNPNVDSYKFNDILDYLKCIDFIKDMKEKFTDENLIIKLRNKLSKNDIDNILNSFKSYFKNYERIKLFYSKDFYGNIKYILNNSIYQIKLFQQKFRVYDNMQKEIEDIIAKDLNGLIRLKYNININFEDQTDNIILDEKLLEELKKKKMKIEIFIKYTEQLQVICEYFSRLENCSFPLFIEVKIILSKDIITYKLCDNYIEYDELIIKLEEYYKTTKEFRTKFYKENEYFRFLYSKQFYRLIKKNE